MEDYTYDSSKKGTNSIDHAMVTTGLEIAGYKIVEHKGVARGIIVRSRSIVGAIGAGLQSLVGGNITLMTQLSEKSRSHAFDLLLEHASDMGANAIVAMRYDATEVAQGMTEVLAYGTAVVVEKI
jgi:uncharacterized protein YbjQ (UPF0145 family)